MRRRPVSHFQNAVLGQFPVTSLRVVLRDTSPGNVADEVALLSCKKVSSLRANNGILEAPIRVSGRIVGHSENGSQTALRRNALVPPTPFLLIYPLRTSKRQEARI
jgi:hypothetical protein